MQGLRNCGMRGLRGAPQDLVAGANGMIGSAAVQDDSWPYFWLSPRSNTQYFQPIVSIPAPASGVQTLVFSRQVPAGFQLVLRGMRQNFYTGILGGPVWTPGSGDILWTVSVDAPIGGTALSGFGLPDLTNMAEERGSAERWWPIEGYTVFGPYQTIQYSVLTTAAIAPGAPNYITCGLFGWYEQLLSSR